MGEKKIDERGQITEDGKENRGNRTVKRCLVQRRREKKGFLSLAFWRENPEVWCGWALALSFVLVAVAAVIPYGSGGQTILVASVGLDKILHFVGFGFMTLLAFGTGRGLAFWKKMSLVLLVLFLGVVIEFIQYYLPYRAFNPIDIVANSLGVGFGGLVGLVGTHRLPR